MYLSFYGLAEKPFSQTPDPKFLYWNDAYRETLASLRYGIQERKGFITMIGEAGTGKTTLLRKLLDDLGPEVVSVFLFNPNATFEEILEYTLSELGIPGTAGRKLAMLQRLNDFLLAAFQEGKTTILLIDEAQDLETEVLESLRLLSNLETSKEKILQIVLSGQPELATKLAQPNLRQLKQRIAVRCRLEPLGRNELAEYIGARVAIAGGRTNLFAPETLDLVWDFARGIPRLINTVCDNALLVGYALGRQTIDREVIAEVVADLAKIDAPLELPPAAPQPSPAAVPEVPPVAPSAPSAAPPASPAAPSPAAAPRAAEGPRQAPRPAPSRAEGPRPTPRRARRLGWVAAVAVLAVAAAGALAAGWEALEPRLSGLLADARRRSAAPSAAAPEAEGRRVDQAVAASSEGPEEDEPAPLPTEEAPSPEPAAGGEPAAARAAVAEAAPREVAPEVETGASGGAPSGPVSVGAAPAHAASEEPAPAHAANEDSAPAHAARDEAAPARAVRQERAAETDARAARPQNAAPEPAAPQVSRVAVDEARAAERAEPAPEPRPVALAALPSAPEAARRDERRRQDLQAARPKARGSKRVRVQRGDTLMNLALREYGLANYTTLDVLREVNPNIEDVNRIIAGSEIVFPDPGPGSRLVEAENGDGVSVLVATTPILAQAQELQRLVGSRYRLPAELEPIVLGDGRNLYRVSLRRVRDRAQAMQIAESLGSILEDPS